MLAYANDTLLHVSQDGHFCLKLNVSHLSSFSFLFFSSFSEKKIPYTLKKKVQISK